MLGTNGPAWNGCTRRLSTIFLSTKPHLDEANVDGVLRVRNGLFVAEHLEQRGYRRAGNQGRSATDVVEPLHRWYGVA